jgi:hypothetical protein
MPDAPVSYKKLVGWRGGIGSRASLWQGADHVLFVEANMMTERYQRMWLRDIQGFLVRPHGEARWVTGLAAAFMLLFAVLAFVDTRGLAVLFWVFFWLVSPVLVYGLLFGRTCRFYAVTAVQRAEWPNVARRRHVKKVLARLGPLVREAQREDVASAPASPDAGGSSADGVSTLS